MTHSSNISKNIFLHTLWVIDKKIFNHKIKIHCHAWDKFKEISQFIQKKAVVGEFIENSDTI